jgi:hypothetical protein
VLAGFESHRLVLEQTVAGFENWNESSFLAFYWCLRGRAPLSDNRQERYRQYARDCLEAAQAVTDQRIRTNLVTIAQSWRVLAEQIERRGKLSLVHSQDDIE